MDTVTLNAIRSCDLEIELLQNAKGYVYNKDAYFFFFKKSFCLLYEKVGKYRTIKRTKRMDVDKFSSGTIVKMRIMLEVLIEISKTSKDYSDNNLFKMMRISEVEMKSRANMMNYLARLKEIDLTNY